MMNYLDMLSEIEQWAKDNGYDYEDPHKQYSKLMEEQGRLATAVTRQMYDKLSLLDSIGHYQIHLILYCVARNLDIKQWVAENMESLNKGVITNDKKSYYYNPLMTITEFIVLVSSSSNIIKCCNNDDDKEKELSEVFRSLLVLKGLTQMYKSSLLETLEMAYNRMR